MFDAEIGATRTHGQEGEETMTVTRIGPHTELNASTVPSSDEADRQTPMWHRGRLDHFGLHAASYPAFATIRERLMTRGASDGTVNDFGAAFSMFFRDPDGLEGEVLVPKADDGSQGGQPRRRAGGAHRRLPHAQPTALRGQDIPPGLPLPGWDDLLVLATA